jgi:hypothetical protein
MGTLLLCNTSGHADNLVSVGAPQGRCRQHRQAVWLLLLVLLCAACAVTTPPRLVVPISPTPNSAATQTVYAQENGPVTVHVSVLQQQGRLVTGSVVLIVRIAVTNHTSKPIWLFVQCPMPAILVGLTGQQTLTQTRQLIGRGLDCMLPDTSMYSQNSGPGIAPAATSVYVQHLSLFNFYAAWSAGSYVLTATVEEWHQGTIDQDNAPGSTFLFGTALGETEFTLS